MQPLLQWKNNEYYTTCLSVCSLRYPACNAHAPYCHLWPARLYSIVPHYVINGRIFGEKNLLNTKCVFWFPPQRLSEMFIILRRIEWDVIKNVYWSSCKVNVIPVRFDWNLNFLYRFSKNPHISNFVKIRPVGAELFHEERRMDRHDANSSFSQFRKRA